MVTFIQIVLIFNINKALQPVCQFCISTSYMVVLKSLIYSYDADVNHAPCLKSGHRGHWALVVGYLIDDHDEVSRHDRHNSNKIKDMSFFLQFYVLARHGKTRNLAVWSLTALSESNANLKEFAQPNGYPDCTFLLPPGGIDGDLGLRERSIVIKSSLHTIITVR